MGPVGQGWEPVRITRNSCISPSGHLRYPVWTWPSHAQKRDDVTGSGLQFRPVPDHTAGQITDPEGTRAC